MAEEILWNGFDSDIEQKFNSFVTQKKDYIKKFDKYRNITTGNGVQLAAQDLIDEYHDILDYFDVSKEKVLDMFSLKDLSKSMERHRKYPTEIVNHHNRKALAWFIGVSSVIATTGLFIMGGSNPEAWAPALKFVCIGSGSVAGLSAATITRIRNWRKFDREQVKRKKLNFMEKRIMKRVQEKERAFSNISLEIGNHMLEILNGDFDIYETRAYTRKKFFLFGPKKTYEKTDLKKDYFQVPPRKRRKLIKIIDKFSHLSKKTEELEEKLNNVLKNEQQVNPQQEIKKSIIENNIPDLSQNNEVTEEISTNAKPEIIVSQNNTPSVSKSSEFSYSKTTMSEEAKDFFSKEEFVLFSSVLESLNSSKEKKYTLADFKDYTALLTKIEYKKEALRDYPNLTYFLNDCKKILTSLISKKNSVPQTQKPSTSSNPEVTKPVKSKTSNPKPKSKTQQNTSDKKDNSNVDNETKKKKQQ